MKKINVTETFLPPKEEYFKLVESLWESKWLTNRGELVVRLENDLQAYLQTAARPLLINNGTVALQIPIKALDIQGEIITTPFSYVATTASIVWENCTPVFVDIHPEHLTIDETLIEAAITEHTSAILAVHVYGIPCAVEQIEAIARKHQLHVIYDAAHCFGVQYKGRSIFDYGDINTCSFHATKLFHTGEGGALFCNRPELYDRLYYHHNFGHNGPEEFHGLGINAKMNELNAAMGLAVLPYMGNNIEKRRQVAELYDKELNWDRLRKPKIREGTTYNYAYYPVIFSTEEALLKAQKNLSSKDIFPRRYFFPSLNTLPYVRPQSMPVAEDISRKILCLPMHADLLEADIIRITEIINRG